jgi:Zn-dependent protease with chaperone function
MTGNVIWNDNALINKKENLYYGIMLSFSILLYLLFIVSVIGILYLLVIGFFVWVMHGLMIGHIKQNAVKVTEKQFPEVYQKVREYSETLKLKQLPEIYIMQEGGMLNALATRFLSRDFVIIYSDILELAYQQGEDAVNFIIAHEMAHIKRGHLTKKKFIILGEFIPFLGLAYSRACETTCDNYAAYLTNNNPAAGMLVLISGKKLYKNVNVDELLLQTQNYGFWSWFAEICSTHPNLTRRIGNVRKAQQSV